MSRGSWTLATRARHTWVEPQVERAREDAIRDMASLYGNAATRARLTPEVAAWEVQQRREAGMERRWGIMPWATERRLGPGRPILWDGPHTGEGGWLTVAQAKAMRAKEAAAAEAETAAAREAERQVAAAEQYARRKARGQEALSAYRQQQTQRQDAAPAPTHDLTIHRVTAWDGPPVQPSAPYRCRQCSHTVTILQAVLPGIYRWRCPRCQAAVRGAVG